MNVSDRLGYAWAGKQRGEARKNKEIKKKRRRETWD